MAYSADWIAKRVTIPVSDLTFVSGSNYTLNIADVHNEMRRMEWDEGLWAINILEHKETLVLSGIPKTRTILVVNGYTWEIAASNIVVSLIGIDSNLMDTFAPANGVSLLSNNSVGKQDVETGSGLNAGQDEKLTAINTEVQYIERWIHIDTEQLTQGIGTQASPFNTLDAALTYMELHGYLRVHTVSDLTLDRQLKNFVIVGVGNPIIDFNGQDIDGSQFIGCQLGADSTGTIRAKDCDLLLNVQVHGRIKDCTFMGIVEQMGDTIYSGCESGVTGLGYPQLKITSGNAGVRGFKGSIGVIGVTAGDHSIGIASDGRFLADATCTGGAVHVRGFPFAIVDNSAIGCAVTDETESEKTTGIHHQHFNKRTWDKAGKTVTIYDDDNITPLHVFDVNDDMSEITPQ